MNKTFNIKSKDYMQLLWNLSFSFRSEVTSGTTKQLHLQETITELGICYTVNSRIAEYNSYKFVLVKLNGKYSLIPLYILRYWLTKKWERIPTPETVVIHPLDGEVYAQIMNMSTSFEVSIL